MLLPRFLAGMLSMGLTVLGTGVVSGQDYPNKLIRIVGGPAGGGGDFIARQIAQGISGPLGQPVVVENRPALLAAEFVSKAPPDGYTLLVLGSTLWIAPLLQKLPYDVERDYAPISLITRQVSLLVVHPSVPVKSIKELIALAKAKPGELNYASAQIGGPPHLAGELFKAMAGVNIVRIGYQATAAAVTGMVSGEVHMLIADLGLLSPHVKSGKLRALAVSSATSSAIAPGLPTVAAAGLPGYEYVGMTHLMAPGKTPSTIINRLNQEVVRVLSRPDVKERFFSVGEEIVGSSPEQLAAIIKSDIAKMGKVINDAGIRVE